MNASLLSETRVESQRQTDSRTDPQLIDAINGGDPAAFEVLYHRHRDWVANLAYHFTGSDGLALAEIAEAVGVPLGTVKSRLHHALESLRNDKRAKQFFEG